MNYLKNIKKQTVFTIVICIIFCLLFFSVLLRNSYLFLDPDLGWHLKIGSEIVQNREIPRIEHYDYPMLGKNWVDHEWLMNAITYLIYNNFGYFAVSVFFALIPLTALIILAFFVKKKLGSKVDYFTIFIFEFFGLLAALPFMGVRLQEITFLNFVLLMIILDQYEKTRKGKILFWLVPIFCFWSLAHAGFMMGIMLLLLWIILKLIEYFFAKKEYLKGKILFLIHEPKLINKRDIVIFSSFLFLIFAITLKTPYGIQLYELFFQTFLDSYLIWRISEWVPMFVWPYKYIAMFYMAVVACSLFCLLSFAFQGKTKKNQKEKTALLFPKITIWEIVLFAIFILMAIKSRRNFPLFFIATFIMTVRTYAFIFYPLKKLLSKKNKINLIFRYVPLFIISIIIIIQILSLKGVPKDPFKNYCNAYPCAAVEFLKNDSSYSQKKMFNLYDWGGFLIWTWPEKTIFIDGRFPSYPLLKDKTFLKEYDEFFDKDKMEDKINQYGVQIILVKKIIKAKLSWTEKHLFGLNENKIKYKSEELINYLEASPDWDLAFSDNISLVFVKK